MNTIMNIKRYTNTLLFIASALLIASCISYKYDYKSKDKLNNIEIYNDPTITKSYSIGTYISVVGVPIGSGILLGNHVYQNAINNGSPKDTATLERNTIIGLGVLAAGLSAYYLAKDTVYPKTEHLSDLYEIKEWYANTIDFNKKIFLGYYCEGNHTYVLCARNEDFDNLYVEDISQLTLMTNIINDDVSKEKLIGTIVSNSIEKISYSDLKDAYIITDRKYPEILFYKLQTAQSFYSVRDIAMELKKGGYLTSSKYVELTAIKYSNTMNKNNLSEVNEWLVLFEDVSSIKVDSIRRNLNVLKQPLVAEEQIRLDNMNKIYGDCKNEITELQNILKKMELLRPNHKFNIKVDKYLSLVITSGSETIYNKPVYNAFLSYSKKYGFKGSLAELTLNTSEIDRFMKKYERKLAPGYHNNPTEWKYKHNRFKEANKSRYMEIIKISNLAEKWNGLIDKLISKKHNSSYLFLESLSNKYNDFKYFDDRENWFDFDINNRVQKIVSVYDSALDSKVISNLFKSEFIDVSTLNNLSIISKEERNKLSNLLYIILLDAWTKLLKGEYKFDWKSHNIKYLYPKLYNYKYIDSEISLSKIGVKHLNNNHKTKLLTFLTQTHNKKVRARKLKLHSLEIGDYWQEGYIEKFNPSKSKVQISVNYNDGTSQLKWIDFK